MYIYTNSLSTLQFHMPHTWEPRSEPGAVAGGRLDDLSVAVARCGRGAIGGAFQLLFEAGKAMVQHGINH